MPNDPVSIGGASSGIAPLAPDASPGSSQKAKSHFGRLRHQVNHAGAQLNGLLVKPIKRKATALFGAKSSGSAEAGGDDDGEHGGDVSILPPPVLSRANSRIGRAPSLHRNGSSGSLSGDSGFEYDFLDVHSTLDDTDSEIEEPETPLVRRVRTRVQTEPTARPDAEAPQVTEPIASSSERPTHAVDLPWPDGHVPTDAEINRAVTRFLAGVMPYNAESRKELRPLLQDLFTQMRDGAVDGPPPPPPRVTTTTTTATPPPPPPDSTSTTVTPPPPPPLNTTTTTTTVTPPPPPPPRLTTTPPPPPPPPPSTTAATDPPPGPPGGPAGRPARPGSSFMEMLAPESLVAGENAPGGGGNDGSHFDRYQERATALQMQAAKMQLNMSVVSAIADLIKTVGSKLESAASRG